LPGFNDSIENLVASQSHIRNIIKHTNVFLNCLSDAKGVSGIIAVDFDTLLAGIILKNIHNVPLVYDAHEYWPEQFTNFSDLTKKFFKSLEKSFLKYADGAWSVSPGLVRELSLEYDKEFHVLPNATPFNLDSRINTNHSSECIRFLFMGNFSEGRGIELLCRLWTRAPAKCHLYLVGPESSYKEYIKNIVKALGLLEKRIFFPHPCAEYELIDMAANYDIGLIPYESINLNHAYCSPNKMGQYMAAGIPIFANQTQYVQSILQESQSGWVCDFTKAEEFYSIISSICDNPEILPEMGRSARKFHETNFNWQKLSEQFYESLDQLSHSTPEIEFYPQYLTHAAPENASPAKPSSEIYRYLTSFPHRLFAFLWKNTPVFVKSFFQKHYNIIKYFHQ
jgi:glycosyltransferase involved in cell wall biosynthesis